MKAPQSILRSRVFAICAESSFVPAIAVELNPITIDAREGDDPGLLRERLICTHELLQSAGMADAGRGSQIMLTRCDTQETHVDPRDWPNGTAPAVPIVHRWLQLNFEAVNDANVIHLQGDQVAFIEPGRPSAEGKH